MRGDSSVDSGDRSLSLLRGLIWMEKQEMSMKGVVFGGTFLISPRKMLDGNRRLRKYQVGLVDFT